MSTSHITFGGQDINEQNCAPRVQSSTSWTYSQYYSYTVQIIPITFPRSELLNSGTCRPEATFGIFVDKIVYDIYHHDYYWGITMICYHFDSIIWSQYNRNLLQFWSRWSRIRSFLLQWSDTSVLERVKGIISEEMCCLAFSCEIRDLGYDHMNWLIFPTFLVIYMKINNEIIIEIIIAI